MSVTGADNAIKGGLLAPIAQLRERLRGRSLTRLLFAPHTVGILDQGVVSATSFLTTVIIGHFTTPDDLGSYSIIVSVLASAYTAQGQLVSLPYSLQRSRQSANSEQHAGSSLVLAALLALLMTAMVAAAALGEFAATAQATLAPITWCLAGIMPFALLRDFSRRYSFVHLRMTQALLVDMAAGTLQIALLVWLGLAGGLSAFTAAVALGASSAIAALAWLAFSRSAFAFERKNIRSTMKLSWQIGKWLGLNQMMVQVQRFSPYWVCALVLGTATTGVLSACLSFVGLMNPLIYGLNNVFTQKSVLAWNEGGGAGLRRRSRLDALMLAFLLAPFCVAALYVGGDAVHLLYRSTAYEGQGGLVLMLAVTTAIWAVSNPASNALASMERARLICAVNTIGAVLTTGLMIVMTMWSGLAGAVSAWFISNVLLTCTLWLTFLFVVERSEDRQSILQILPQLDDARHLVIAKLGEGDHAKVYAARLQQDLPIWGTHRSVIVKLYKPEAALAPQLAAEQLSSLARLNKWTDGRVVNGWTVSTPKPLFVHSEPLALLMTQISHKRELKASMGVDPHLTPAALAELGSAVVHALREAWSHGEIHGDLALQNILYNVSAKELSFIDPGTHDCCRVCNTRDLPWKAAVLELGHMLRDFGTDVRNFRGHPAARRQRGLFVKSAVLAHLETIESQDARLQTINEIRDCALFHLSKVLKSTWITAGPASRPLTRFVTRRVDALMAEVIGDMTARRAASAGTTAPTAATHTHP